MKKIIFTLLLSTFTLTSCGESTNNLINTDNESIYSSFSKNSRNIFSIVEKVNADYKKRNPEIINIKYKAMSESAFAFYRATAYLFYMDTSKTDINIGVNVPLQGDLHLDNIGTYFASNGKVYYDLNDFDDAFTGSYSLDVSRLLTSIYLAAEESGFSKEDKEDFAEEFLDEYKKYHEYFSSNKNAINQPFTQLGVSAQKAVEKTASNNYSAFVNEISSNGKFIYSDKIRKLSPEIFNNVSQAVKNYSQSKLKTPSAAKIKDIGVYIAGKGSLGRYRYIILLEGDTTKSTDDLVLEIKEAAQPSSTFVKPEVSGNQAQRVLQANKYFLSYPDTLLGTTTMGNLSFYVRRVMPDEKVNLKKINKKSDFKEHIKTVAGVVAKAHAKSGKSQNILSDLKVKKDIIKEFSKDYSKQVISDFEEFKKSF